MTALFYEGNSLSVLQGLPADFFHCVVTSPPYFGLRRYDGGIEDWNGWSGQLGAEPTPDLYIQHLVQICGEVKRVLRPDGVFWLNIGDSWAGSWGSYGHRSELDGGTSAQRAKETSYFNRRGYEENRDRPPMSHRIDGIKPLDMVLIPQLLALSLRADGWYVRSQVIWSKNNPMPESVNGWRWEKHRVKVAKSARADTDSYHSEAYGDSPMGARDGRDFLDHSPEYQDCLGCDKCSSHNGYVLRKGSWRPTDSYEVILMLTKTDNYYCDREAVREGDEVVVRKAGGYKHDVGTGSNLDGVRNAGGLSDRDTVTVGRNLRSVWSFPTSPYSGAHFATYPPRLVELCVKSSTSEKGCCSRCGTPYARIVEKGFTAHDGTTEGGKESNANRIALLHQAARENGGEYASSSKTIGWLPTCSCTSPEPSPCRVLDPFSGAGTTALVCERLGLDSFNVDTSAKYIQLARERLEQDEQKRLEEQLKKIRRGA